MLKIKTTIPDIYAGFAQVAPSNKARLPPSKIEICVKTMECGISSDV